RTHVQPRDWRGWVRAIVRPSARRPSPRSVGAARRWFPALNAWRSTDVAGVFLQQGPGFIAEFGFRVLVKRCLRERRLEGFRLGGIEGEALRLKLLLVIRICL